MEKDLFEPVKALFSEAGYVCDGEVQDIDLYMEKDGVSVAVELKLTLDFKAVQQAALRQKVADHVFIAIFRPKDLKTGHFQDKLYLLKRLGIGLILVSKRTMLPEIVLEPVVSELSRYQKQNAGKRKTLEAEFQRRKAKNNTGGVHRTRVMTGYREEALLVLDALVSLGSEAKAEAVRDASGVEKAQTILYRNYYHWFSRAGEGIYRVTDEGYQALEEFEETLYVLKKSQPVGTEKT